MRLVPTMLILAITPIITSIMVVVIVIPVVKVTAAATATVTILVIATSLRVVALGVRVGHNWPVTVLLLVSSSRISNLVTDLATCLATAELAMRLEAVIPVHSHYHSVKYLPVQSVDSE